MREENWQLINRDGMRFLALADGTTFPTRHSPESISAIYQVKSPEGYEWFVDEVQRAELPNSISEHLRAMIDQLQLSDNSRVLDFGAGSGASTVALAYNGFRNIESVEIDEKLVGIARLRARDFGYQDRINFHTIKPGDRLPFAESSFDLVVCYAVIEHIHPAQREAIMQDLWRLLKPQGVMLILETPNILFPYGDHYPFLYFTPWMPLPMVKAYGRLRGRIQGDISDEELYLAGLRGTTVRKIQQYLGHQGRVLPSLSDNPEELYLQKALERDGNSTKSMLKKAIVYTYQNCLKPLGVPFCTIFPQLNFGLKKAA